MRTHTRHLLVLALSWGVAATANGQATFERLGYVFGANPWSRSKAISSNGLFVVGGVGGAAPNEIRAFRWSREHGMVLLPSAGLNPALDVAGAVADDGSVVVGYGWTPEEPRAVAWVHGRLTFLPTLPNSTFLEGIASDITRDGSTIVGSLWPDRTATVPVRWRDGKVEDLSRLPGDAVFLGAGALAEDGHPATLAGGGYDGGQRAVRVHRDHVHQLGDIPGARRGIEQLANDISDDGRRIVGRSSSPTLVHSEAYLWSKPTGMVGLGTIPAAFNGSQALCISGDGRIVGGQTGTDQFYRYRAFIWDPVRGMRLLNAVLDAYGIDRQGWSLDRITGISHDGTAMTGNAADPGYTRHEAYLVTVPPWCWADCTGDDAVDFNDLLCFLNRFERAQDPRANPVDFFYCDLALDDEIDFNDFLAFLNLYHAGCPR